MSRIHVLHENREWTAPLLEELDEAGLPYEDWFLEHRELELSAPPPEGVFYNRMSASSHTRGHRFAPELTGAVLAWLESHQRRVLNGERALQLEISKVAQYSALRSRGIPTPRTIAAVGREEILRAAATFERPFITKHNRGGKGLGVHLFRTVGALEDYLDSERFEAPIDGILLLQEYIESPDARITRCEFVGGQFLYAVRVDTSEGFELCPADDCQPGDAFCPATSESVGASVATKARFEIVKDFEHPLLERLPGFLKANSIDVAAVEFVVDEDGNAFVYDVNTNTNYNRQAEIRAGVSGMRTLASHLGRVLSEETMPALVSACAR